MILQSHVCKLTKVVCTQIYETTGLSTTLLSEVYSAIPESNITADNVHLEELEFSSDQRVSHSHEGVGSSEHLACDRQQKPIVQSQNGF